MNNWIPVIVILAVLAGGGYYAYRKIKRKVEDVSQALFGTDSLVECEFPYKSRVMAT